MPGSREHAQPPHPLKQKIKDGILALSLANLCFAPAWYYVLWLDKEAQYFKKLPLTQATLAGLAVNMFWFAALVWVVIRAWRRWQNRWFHLACDCVFLLVWLVPLDFFRKSILHVTDLQVVAFFRRPAGALAVLVVLAFVAWKHRRVVRALAVVTRIMSPLAFFTLGWIALLSFGPHHPPHEASEPPLAPLSPVRAGQPRVVWMIFDETDQRLAFEQRPSCLQMPEFDRFRRECLSATNAYPPGPNTLESVPGLTTGLRISWAIPKSASELALKIADTGKVISWADLPSVFDSARELGINTALVGWYHPYPRVLGRSLNYCSWYPCGWYQPVRAPSLVEAMASSLEALLWNFHIRELHADMCRSMLADSLSLTTNSTYGLVFLHLAPPHSPGVFNPSTGRYTVLNLSKVRGYFDNLVLADRTLGGLRRAMETSGQWDTSWVIVSTDHSWRGSPLYDGKRDLRVPFFVKVPGAAQPTTYSHEINTALTHDLVLAVLRGELTNQQQTVTWLDAHPCTPRSGNKLPAHDSAQRED